ncbi:hypothetical protein Vadar_023429 [Vaccinium darrowii]|uniref:Uncharacterized protein n=1 Tax=Vaccinium darrowii TaxID=229202 RepID=A0ACB7XSS1_9ERIC|nr:hypothetical protein Vadar_023429 [Vaccinium darrowii]
MSSTSRAWVAAASDGAVEALKDQGFCRWIYRSTPLHQHAENNLRPFCPAKKLSPSSSSMVSRTEKTQKTEEAEDSMRKVMYLSCWDIN